MTQPLSFGELKDTILLALEGGDDKDEEEHEEKDGGALKVPS